MDIQHKQSKTQSSCGLMFLLRLLKSLADSDFFVSSHVF